jgi:hypothetical protein
MLNRLFNNPLIGCTEANLPSWNVFVSTDLTSMPTFPIFKSG